MEADEETPMTGTIESTLANIEEGVRRRKSMKQAGQPELNPYLGQAPTASHKDDHKEGEPGSIGTQFTVALLCCFMGVTDGLSIGSLLFPKGTPAAFMSLGITMGLLSTLVVNFTLTVGSGVRFGVAGAVIPMIATLPPFIAAEIGPENPETILVAVPLMAIIFGVVLLLASRIGVQSIVATTPYSVFGGFIAGTGAQLLQFGLSMMAPTFEGFFTNPLALLDEGALVLWAPSFILGAAIYGAQKMPQFANAHFLLPGALLAATIIFYASLFFANMSMDGARDAGYLFSLSAADHSKTVEESIMSFMNIWKLQDFSRVQWSKIASAQYLVAVINACAIGLLSIVQNVYALKEMTRAKMDVDKEVRLAGMQNLVLGAVGGMPGGICMSYAATAFKLGGNSTTFGVFLTCLSVVFFVCGDLIVATLPKLVPSAVLIWLAFWLLADWVYTKVGHVPWVELFIVWIMILIDLFAGAGPMLFVGLMGALMLNATAIFKSAWYSRIGTVVGVRSTMWRSFIDNSLLKKHGKKASIIDLARGPLSFTNASLIAAWLNKRFDAHLLPPQSEGYLPPLSHLVLIMNDITSIDVTGLKCISEMAEKSKKQKFFLLLVDMRKQVFDALKRYGVKTDILIDQKHAHTLYQAVKGLKDYGTVYVVNEMAFTLAPGIEVQSDGLNPVLATVEQCILNDVQEDPAELVDKSGCDFNPSYEKAAQEIISQVSQWGPKDKADPKMRVLVDFHCWQNKYCKEYKAAEILPLLRECLMFRKFKKWETIYTPLMTRGGAWEDRVAWPVTAGGNSAIDWRDKADELLPGRLSWLVSGSLMGTYMGYKICKRQGKNDPPPNNLQLLARMSPVLATKTMACLGPLEMAFKTGGAFLLETPIQRKITAMEDDTLVVMLKDGTLGNAFKKSPALALCLVNYITRKSLVRAHVDSKWDYVE